jgi:hypothetical protein
MARIATPAAFDAALAAARADMDRLVTRYPGNAALESACRQLAHVTDWTRGGARPTAEQVGRLSVGLIAVREIEILDLPLAERLYALCEYLEAQRE